MNIALEVLALMLASVTMSLTLAHALELPGKLRLTKEQYLTVQPIYYPGFTIGGFAEVAVLAAAIALLVITPPQAQQFGLIAAAFVAFAVVQVIFWTMTQPVNKYWLRHTDLGASGKRFFETGAAADVPTDWRVARDRWEQSHVLRAVAASAGMLLLAIAVAM
jgi:hypothetical protein